MLYAVGLNNDKTLQRFAYQARELGESVTLINLHDVCCEPWCIMIPSSYKESRVYNDSQELVLTPESSYFVRLVDLSPGFARATG